MFFFSTFDMDKLAKIRHHHCKKRLKISKIAQFESNLLKPNKDIGPQRRKILHTFYDVGNIQLNRNVAKLLLFSLPDFARTTGQERTPRD